MMRHLLLPGLTTLAVLMMMPVSASAVPALPMNDVLAGLDVTKTTLIQTGMKSKRKRARRALQRAQGSATGQAGQLSAETSQQTGVFNPGAAQALRLLHHCTRPLGPDDLIPIGCENY